MAEQVLRRRDVATNLQSFVGGPGELIVDTTNDRVQVHDGVTPGGWPAAKEAELQSEAQTRAAADAAETARAETAEAANAQNIANNTNAIGAEVARAEAAEAALATIIAGKASASDLAANTQFANALYPPERPGDGFAYFTSVVGPATTLAGGFPPIQNSTIQVGAEGAAVAIIGPGYLISREFYPIEPNRTYLARVALSVTQPGLGQPVTFGFFQYNAAKALIGVSQVVVTSFASLFPASGRQAAQGIVTRVLPLPAGDIGVDPTARYVRLVIQNTDPFQYVAVEVMRWVDITDSSVFAPSVATLQAQIGQLASQLAAMTQNFYVAASAKISDTNYAALAADGGVEMVSLTAPRTVTLPPLSAMPALVPFPVADTNGKASSSTPITIVPAGSDLLNGLPASAGGIVMSTPYQIVAPRPGSGGSWLLV